MRNGARNDAKEVSMNENLLTSSLTMDATMNSLANDATNEATTNQPTASSTDAQNDSHEGVETSQEPSTSSSLNEVSTLRQNVSETAKDLRARLELVRGRRQLKAEQAADEQEVRAAREERSRKVLQENADTLDETRVVLDNLVNHFQSISSRYNRTQTNHVTRRAEERGGDGGSSGRSGCGGGEEPRAVRSLDEVGLSSLPHVEKAWWRSPRSSWRTSSVTARLSRRIDRWWLQEWFLTTSVRR